MSGSLSREAGEGWGGGERERGSCSTTKLAWVETGASGLAAKGTMRTSVSQCSRVAVQERHPRWSL